MLIELPYSTPLAAVVALVPAGLRWWWGRTLAPLAADPAFPERLAAHRLRAGRSFGVACAVLIVLFTHTLLWSLPVLALSCIVASFQFRRVIYRESWSLADYLSFVLRAIVAVFGFWLLLAGLPAIALLAGHHDWMLALLLAAVLAFWNTYYTDAVRALMLSKPIDNPALASRFLTLAQASSAGTPRFEQVRLGGGAIANAIALPSIRRPAVLFTDTLLSRLQENEIVAICGHELAHLEYYNPARLRQHNIGNILLIAGSVLIVLAARLIGTTWISLSIVWPCVVVGAMGWRVRNRQQQETDSDLRAVALTGDPEGLASALIKIHAYAHVPRRVDAELEQHASHPSLARRIKAIRAATPGTPPPATAATFVAPDSQTQVTFANDRLEWREGDAALHSLSYGRLTELRVVALPSGQTRLLVVERGGRRWQMTLSGADLARAQGVLDLVDGQLSEPTPAATASLATQRVVTLVAISVSVLSGQIATILVALLAMFRPSAPFLAAAGAAMIAAAGLSLRQPDWVGLDLPWVPVAIVGVGGFLLWSAWKARDLEWPQLTPRLIAGLGVLSLLAVAAVLAGSTDVVRAHQSARMLPAAAVWPIAFAAALAHYRHIAARVGAAVSVTVALAVTTLGSISFLDRFGSDPMLLAADALKQVPLNVAPSTEFVLPFYAMDVQLSPGGKAVAARDMRSTRSRSGELSTIAVGRPGGKFSSTTASGLVFLDDEHVLTVREDDEGTEIAQRALSSLDAPLWRHRVPGLVAGRLSVDPQANRWRLLGWDSEKQVVRARGVIGASDLEITRWVAPDIDQQLWPMAIAASEQNALLVETQYDLGGLDMLSVRTLAVMLNPGATVSRLWQLGQHSHKDLGVSQFATDCSPEVLMGERLVCSSFDGTRTRIVALDPATGERTAFGFMEGRFIGDEHPPAGWLTGWREMTPVAVRLRERQIVTVPREHALAGFAATDRFLATVTVDGTRSRVRLYPLPGAE